ncbi:MAG: DUF1579 domain-containing protein [Gemmatimonadales bacterium]
MRFTRLAPISSLLVLTTAIPCYAQRGYDPAAAIAAQKAAMATLSMMDGIWRGPASTILENGTKHDVIQTERIGPFLDGSIKLLEGRGYDAATGAVTFNAFGTISYDQNAKAYTIHSYAQGRAGDFKLTPTADGYSWEIPAGPVTIRYTAVIKDGAWKEVGDQIIPGRDPVRFFEMNLKRVGNSDWPGAGAIPKQ